MAILRLRTQQRKTEATIRVSEILVEKVFLSVWDLSTQPFRDKITFIC